MKILVTGANGMLAKEVKEKFAKENEVIATDVSELDITNEKKVDWEDPQRKVSFDWYGSFPAYPCWKEEFLRPEWEKTFLAHLHPASQNCQWYSDWEK